MKQLEKNTKELRGNFGPNHNAYCSIVLESNLPFIHLINNGKYFSCSWPLSEKLYNFYTKGEYAFTSLTGGDDECPAQEYLQTFKYLNFFDKINYLNNQLYYDFDTQEIVLLYQKSDELLEHTLFPIGYLYKHDDDFKTISHFEDVNIKKVKDIIINKL